MFISTSKLFACCEIASLALGTAASLLYKKRQEHNYDTPVNSPANEP
jgi:hypothetical protein